MESVAMARQPPKCCCCVPLRPGLLAWAYIKLVLILGLTGWHLYLCVEECRYAIYIEDKPFQNATEIILILLPVGVCLLHLNFTTIFIIGVHHKGFDALHQYLAYFMFELAVASGWAGYNLYTGIVGDYNRNLLWLYRILPVALNIMWTIYLSELVGNELHFLEKAGEETNLPSSVTKKQDKRYNIVNPNVTPERRKHLFPVEELEMLRQQSGVTDV